MTGERAATDRPSAPRAPRRRSGLALSPLTTMNDIAQMAGVSESTVSRALSGSPLVAHKTRERILKLAQTAKYAVNEQARGLAMGLTRTIEVMFPIETGTLQRVSDPFFVDMLAVLTDALAERGYDALLSKSTPWSEVRPRCAFLGGRADGVIFVGQGRHPAEVRDFARANRRVVTWGAVAEDSDHVVVGSDNVGGGYAATKHMLDMGRKRIVFLGDRGLAEIRQRYDGYRMALRAAGLEVRDEFVVPAAFDIVEARTATAGLAELYPAFDAVFASSDMIALAAIANLRAAGVDVPRDVSVVGFDDIAAGAHVHPSLTTVHQSIRRGGVKLVEKMMALLAGEDVGSETLSTELIVRESCGAPTSAGRP
ncbi:MAG: LacI family DNA-binding transcriptional regulator [Parvularculaceae bacterium]